MTGDPLADLIATAIWPRTYRAGDHIVDNATAAAATAVRAWIVEQIDHERRDWRVLDPDAGPMKVAVAALDGLQERIEEGAA